MSAATSLPLRGYQRDAIEAVRSAERRGIRRPLVALPTGTGKTVVFSHLIRQRGGRAVLLAHRDELLRQAAEKIRVVDPTAEVGVVKAETDETDATIVVASVQTLAHARRLARLRPDFRTVVVDEAHHAVAETYRRILGHLGAFGESGPLTVGFTATPERGDGVGLDAIFEEIVYRKGILGMVDAGYLSDLRAVQVRLEADFGGLHVRRGDFVERELEETLMGANAPEHTVSAYRQHADGRKALLFTPTVVVAHAMATTFRAAGIAAEALDGDTAAQERSDILARLRTGATRVVTNCAVLTEGFDEPSVDCVIIARPTASRPLYVQMIGRGTRTHPGKEDCLILDLVGAATRHDLVTAANLFGLPSSQLERRTLGAAIAAKREEEEVRAATGRLVARAVDVFRRRPLRWVQTGQRFALPLGDGYLTLEPHGDGWNVVQHAHGELPSPLATRLPLGYAQGFAEDQARRMGAAPLVNPNAAWRRRPASEKQLTILRRRGIPSRRDLTAGDASDLITAALAGGGR